MVEKDLKWLGSSYEDLLSFPNPARKDAGYNLGLLQNGEDPIDWKPMNTIGQGVKELRIHAKGEYRVIYIAKFNDAVYVLHALHKKTRTTAKRDIEIARSRLKELKRKR